VVSRYLGWAEQVLPGSRWVILGAKGGRPSKAGLPLRVQGFPFLCACLPSVRWRAGARTGCAYSRSFERSFWFFRGWGILGVMGELSASGGRGAKNCLRPGMWMDGLSRNQGFHDLAGYSFWGPLPLCLTAGSGGAMGARLKRFDLLVLFFWCDW